MKNKPWVLTIADVIKRCEIEANLDEMVLDSQNLNVSFMYEITFNSVGGEVECC